jgi:membrane protein
VSATTALGLAGLAAFGLSFVSAVQVGFERIWALPPARLMSVWRRVVWLAGLVGFLFVAADTSLLPADSVMRTIVQTSWRRRARPASSGGPPDSCWRAG